MAMQIDLKKYWKPVGDFISRFYLVFVLAEAALIVVGGWFLLINPQLIQVQEASLIGYGDTVIELEDRQNQLVQLKQMEQQYQGLNLEQLTQLEAYLPVGLDPTTLILTMDGFAEAADVEIISIDVVKPEQEAEEAGSATEATSSSFRDSSIRTAVITMSVQTQEGSYAELKQFLDVMENFVPVLNLQNLSYAPETVSYALQLQTYYIQPATAAVQPSSVQ